MSILGWIVLGLVAGALARLLVPGRDPIGCLGTILLGIAGAFVGGFLADVLFDDEAVGFVGATAGSVIVLLIWRAVAGDRRRIT